MAGHGTCEESRFGVLTLIGTLISVSVVAPLPLLFILADFAVFGLCGPQPLFLYTAGSGVDPSLEDFASPVTLVEAQCVVQIVTVSGSDSQDICLVVNSGTQSGSGVISITLSVLRH